MQIHRGYFINSGRLHWAKRGPLRAALNEWCDSVRLLDSFAGRPRPRCRGPQAHDHPRPPAYRRESCCLIWGERKSSPTNARSCFRGDDPRHLLGSLRRRLGHRRCSTRRGGITSLERTQLRPSPDMIRRLLITTPAARSHPTEFRCGQDVVKRIDSSGQPLVLAV